VACKKEKEINNPTIVGAWETIMPRYDGTRDTLVFTKHNRVERYHVLDGYTYTVSSDTIYFTKNQATFGCQFLLGQEMLTIFRFKPNSDIQVIEDISFIKIAEL
jgi:hypothetical protein